MQTSSLLVLDVVVPHCLRADVGQVNEGFFFVFSGRLVVDSFSLKVFEAGEDGSEVHDMPALSGSLFDITKISFNLFVSGHKRYAGGRIRMTGQFGRPQQEILTLKLPYETFIKVRNFLAKNTVVGKGCKEG